jgi:kynurenine formamidase
MSTVMRMPAIVALAIAAPLTAGPSLAADCPPSPWGAEDEIGAANRITPESLLGAAKLVKRGKSAHLGMVIDTKTPAFPPRGMSLQIAQPGQQWGRAPYPNGFGYNDDVFQGWFGIGSQLDGLGHVGRHGRFYNCLEAKDFVETTGVTRLGIEKVPPLVARGIVLDMAAHFGVEHLKGGQSFSAADVEAVAKKQATPIREGDVVLFYTGWTEHVLPRDPALWGSQEPGISEDAAVHLASKKVIAVGADTWGVDVVPPEKKDRPFQGHITLLVENGIYILEGMNSGSLVKDQAFEFLFVLGVPRIRGAVQGFANPTALY